MPQAQSKCATLSSPRPRPVRLDLVNTLYHWLAAELGSQLFLSEHKMIATHSTRSLRRSVGKHLNNFSLLPFNKASV